VNNTYDKANKGFDRLSRNSFFLIKDQGVAKRLMCANGG